MKNTILIPVIHMINEVQVMENIHTAKECGVERVFLINHSGSNEELIEVALLAKVIHSDLWIGINLLGYPTARAISLEEINPLDGLWCDAVIDPVLYEHFRTFPGQFFGSLAFKYQKQPSDLIEACEIATKTSDVATTSGPGTGKAADDNKIQFIRHHLGNHPMAIASGVSKENILNYKGVVDYLLVASSITDHAENIIPEKLIELLDLLK